MSNGSVNSADLHFTSIGLTYHFSQQPKVIKEVKPIIAPKKVIITKPKVTPKPIIKKPDIPKITITQFEFNASNSTP